MNNYLDQEPQVSYHTLQDPDESFDAGHSVEAQIQNLHGVTKSGVNSEPNPYKSRLKLNDDLPQPVITLVKAVDS